MATAVHALDHQTQRIPDLSDDGRAQTTSTSVAAPRNSATTAAVVLVGCALFVLAATTTLILSLTTASVGAALGVGVFCAFWLGGGFGTIFASAAVFGRQH